MAQNLLRFYKPITIELLEDLLKFFEDELHYTGDGKRELKKEGTFAINEAISFIKNMKDLRPMFWNKYAAKAA